MQGELTLDPALVERFRRDLESLTGEAPAPHRPLGVAVSGGSDSLALLLLARSAYPDAVRAATVDHGLRPESAVEAAFVAMLCAERAVEHDTLRADPNLDVGLLVSLQQRARAIRYRCLASWARQRDLSIVALAHQRDDVAESFLMRAGRGAGVDGLAAMPRIRSLEASPARLVRPLLDWSRSELRALVGAAGLVPVDDPMNADDRFDRTRARRLLAETPDLPPDRLARAAHNLRDVADTIQWVLEREYPSRVVDDSPVEIRLRTHDLPFELRRQFVIGAIEDLRTANGKYDDWRKTGVADLVRLLDTGRSGTVAEVCGRVTKGSWRFRLAPPRRAS